MEPTINLIIGLFVDHTATNVTDAITDILANWELNQDCVVAVTTDSGSNMIVAFRDFHMVFNTYIV